MVDSHDPSVHFPELFLKSLGPVTEDSPLAVWAALLTYIVKSGPKSLDSTYRNGDAALSILYDNADLLNTLKEAWRENSYQKIINSGEYPYLQRSS